MVKNMKVEKFEKFPNKEQARFLITSVVTVKVINRMRAMDAFGRFSMKNVLTYCVRVDLGKHMPPDFVKDVIDAFSKIKEEIDEKRGELDFRHSLANYLLKNVLGWGRKKGEGHYEIREREDIRLFNGQNRCVAIIETKNPRIARLTDAHRSELKEHLDDYKGMAQYGALTNGHELKLFEYTGEGELNELASINIDEFVGKGAEALSKTERQKVHLLRRLRRDRFVAVGPEYFRKTAQTIKIEEPRNFDLFIEDLKGSLDELTRVIYERFFKFYWEGGPNHYGGKFLREEAFRRWKGTSVGKEEELEEKFCKETAYVILNRILFTRILEDKEIVKRMISGEGIADLLKWGEGAYEMALKQAYKNVEKFYEHFYEFGIFDWWRLPEDKLGMLTDEEKRTQKEIEDEFNTVVVRDILKRLNQFDFRKVGRDILGDVYQEYLPPAERKRLGEFYTPIEVVRYILDAVGYTPESRLEDKPLLDPACGSGTFLVEAAKRLAKRYDEKLKYPYQPDNAKVIIEGIINNIHGLDINPFACHIAEMNLLFNIIDYLHAVHSRYKDYRLPRFDICCTDSLMPPEMEAAPITEYVTNGRIRSYIEETKRAGEIKKKQFEFVVGNPPYVRVQTLSEKAKGEYNQLYESAFGSYDIYCLFIERGLRWLVENGKIGYITSNQFMMTDYGERIIKIILDNAVIERILDFRDTGVFKDATNYPAITILKKVLDEKIRSATEFKYVRVKQKKKADQILLNEIISNFDKDSFYSSEFDIYRYAQKDLSLKYWSIIPPIEKNLFKRLQSPNFVPFKDITSAIFQGVRTSANNVYVGKLVDSVISQTRTCDFIPSGEQSAHTIECELLRKFLQGREIKRWKLNWSGLYLLHPYSKSKDGVTTLCSQKYLKEKLPKTWDFFLKHKVELENREKGRMKNRNDWHGYIYPKNLEKFEVPKIIAADISNKNSFVLDEGGEWYFTGGYGILLKDEFKDKMKYVLGLLNSKTLEFYFKQLATIKQGGFYEYRTQYLERLPIKIPKTLTEQKIANKIMQHVEQIHHLNKHLDELEEKIEKFPESYFGGEKLVKAAEECKLSKDKYNTKSLALEPVKKAGRELYKLALTKEDYILFSSQTVAKCALEQLKRKSKVRIEEIHGLKVPSEKDASRIMAEFSSDKERVEEIWIEVEKLEQEIDKLVYELYGLNAKDREVIEEFLKKF